MTRDADDMPKPAVQPESPQGLMRLESRGLLPHLSPPHAGAPVFDADPAEYLVGPPDDAGVASRASQGAPARGWTFMLATALRGASPDKEALVEAAFVHRSDVAMSADAGVRRRALADQVALLEVDYLSACNKYHEAEEQDAPRPEQWKNPQHLLEAMKVHERRMDRLQRGMRDAHERWVRALELLDHPGTPGPGSRSLVGVELSHTGDGTSRVRVGTK